MSPTSIIDASTGGTNRHAVEDHANDAGKMKQDQVSQAARPPSRAQPVTDYAQDASPFLSLPAEIRNAIYHDVLLLELYWQFENGLDNECIREQPAITRVNRQLRAESLPVFFAGGPVLPITTESSQDWVPYIQRLVDAYTGGPGGPPGSSTLRHLRRVQIDFLTGTGIHIEVDLAIDPGDLSERAPDDPSERVMVGSPALDWTDAAAVRAACDEAAVLLEEEEDLMRRLTPDEGLVDIVSSSDVDDRIAALDALCIFALACPHLTSVCICDSSRTAEIEVEVDPPELDFMSYVEIMAEILAEEEE